MVVNNDAQNIDHIYKMPTTLSISKQSKYKFIKQKTKRKQKNPKEKNAKLCRNKPTKQYPHKNSNQ